MRKGRFAVWLIISLLLFCLLCCSGCGILPQKFDTFPEEQVLLMDGKGELLQPVGNVSENTYSSLFDFDKEVEDERAYLRRAALKIADQLQAGKDVVLYLHGGLNLQVDTMERAHNMLRHTNNQAGTVDELPYFVFINWQSSLGSSYMDRLFAIREGKDYSNRGWAWDTLTYLEGLTLYLSSDLLSGIARSPATLERQFSTFIANSSLNVLPEDIALSKQMFSDPMIKDQITQIVDNQQDFGRTIPSTLTSPFRIITTPIVDTFGVHTWDIMQRRVSILCMIS
ncbi:MAG: hypothetical protein D3923_09100, partial [Candidatus Electrothrix sp. AR3]|nr:hypothetical protein [Candidatus Electrothrix sp. AR3]